MNYRKPDGLDNRDLFFYSSSCLKPSVSGSAPFLRPWMDSPTLLSRAHADVYNLSDGETEIGGSLELTGQLISSTGYNSRPVWTDDAPGLTPEVVLSSLCGGCEFAHTCVYLHTLVHTRTRGINDSFPKGVSSQGHKSRMCAVEAAYHAVCLLHTLSLSCHKPSSTRPSSDGVGQNSGPAVRPTSPQTTS